MIAVDTNILLYAHQDGSPRQRSAQGILSALAWDPDALGNPRLLPRRIDAPAHASAAGRPVLLAGEGLQGGSSLLETPSLTLLRPGPHYAQLLLEAIREVNAVGNLVFDAQIVALCREHGVSKLFTEDRDFDRFKGFRTERLEI